MTVRFLHLHFKFTFTFTFSPLYNHRILPVTFVTFVTFVIASQSFYFFTILLFYLQKPFHLHVIQDKDENNLGQLLHFS